jgi:EAL domain-containing protein (putative c-di-GMP-specific phosphodiesterase class I)/GGDEF domain-containing protein
MIKGFALLKGVKMKGNIIAWNAEVEKDFILRGHLIEIIKNLKIIPHFQPIVDLYTGEIHGYEILSRAESPFENPALMFEKARLWGLSWELEYACRSAALKKISTLPPKYRGKKFFLNISPDIFSDPRFISGTTKETLKLLELNPGDFVIEITETTSVNDYDQFEKIIQYYVSQGFHIALDDFGAGHSGLITLVAMSPHYLKIDRALISNINESSYKQNLIKSIIAFSTNVDSSIIAEGIETYEELRTVFRLGIRYGQGFFLAKPAPEPQDIPPEIFQKIDELVDAKKRTRFSFDISISSMVIKPLSLQVNSTNCNELDILFKKNNKIDHVIIIDEGRPVFMVTRLYFYSILSGKYGYAIYQKKKIDTIAKREILCINEHSDLRTVSNLAMNRKLKDLYDPVVIVDNRGHFIGTVTMKQVINKAFDLEIKIATCANPLTQLPGNMIIGFWLEELLLKDKFSVLYCDLDHFKEYNDTYGFIKGDEVLKSLSRVLSNFIENIPNTRLGHIGGDDFIIVSETIVKKEQLEELCRLFDKKRVDFFSSNHVSQGQYYAINRQGEKKAIPLISLSIAVVTEKNFHGVPHPGQLGQVAAMLKKQVKLKNKEQGQSNYLFDRRRYAISKAKLVHDIF